MLPAASHVNIIGTSAPPSTEFYAHSVYWLCHRNQREEPCAFDHILIILFENQYRGYVLGNPYMRRLARQGVQLGNYFGVMHPSQTNYIASIAGELCNVTSDEQPSLLMQRTIVDLIEEAPGRLRWKAYMESYVPNSAPWMPDFTPQNGPPYFIKHNPFSSFSSIVRDQERWRHIDNEAGLFADLLNGEFPEYAWFTPNIWNDGHWIDGTEIDPKPRAPILVDQLARWLEGFFFRIRFPGPDSHLPPRTLVVVTFDESDFEADYLPALASSYDGPNHVYTVLLADHLEPGFEEEGYNHYSLLRTFEQNFSIGHLGKNDAGSNWFQFLWGRRFEWSAPQDTPFDALEGPIATAGFGGALFVACAAPDGTVRLRTRSSNHGRWSPEEKLAVDGFGGLAMASTFTELVLSGSLPIRSRAVHAIRSASRMVGRNFSRRRAMSQPLPWRPLLTRRESCSPSAMNRASFPRAFAAPVRRSGAWGEAVPVEAARSDGADSFRRARRVTVLDRKNSPSQLDEHRFVQLSAVQRRHGEAEQIRRPARQHHRGRLVSERLSSSAFFGLAGRDRSAAAISATLRNFRTDRGRHLGWRDASGAPGRGQSFVADRDIFDFGSNDAWKTGFIQERSHRCEQRLRHAGGGGLE